jgi:hypothetical protein
MRTSKHIAFTVRDRYVLYTVEESDTGIDS